MDTKPQADDVHMSMGDPTDEQVVLDAWQKFSGDDDETWSLLLDNRRSTMAQQAHPMFLEGMQILGLDESRGVPDMNELNRKLSAINGWQAVPVPGLIASKLFFEMMEDKKFPVGNFIRDREDLGYTPAPDIFHDAFGHLPFLVHQGYADFVQELGRAGAASTSQEILARFERMYWFTIEFGLVKTPEGMRIYGGGLLSSNDESAHALTDAVTKLPYDLRDMAGRSYHNNEMQSVVYVVDSIDEVYASMGDIQSIAKMV